MNKSKILLLLIIVWSMGSAIAGPFAISEAEASEPCNQAVMEMGGKSLGQFEITFYCCCELCCGKSESDPAYGITASGKEARGGITIAVDKSLIPLGSEVYIEGYGLKIAQDTGGAIKGNHIDIYVQDHEKALTLGVDEREVYLID